MLPLYASILMLSASQPSDFQTVGGIDIKTNLVFAERSVPQAGVKLWAAESEVTSSEKATQARLVVTDLNVLPKKLTPVEVCQRHEQAAWNRRGFSGVFLKVERTVLAGNPMTVVYGSALTKDALGKVSYIYQASSAIVKGDKAYELSWLTRDFPGGLLRALDACRTLGFSTGGARSAPKKLIEPGGVYSLVGMPYGFRLTNALTPDANVFFGLPFSNRYKGSFVVTDWMVKVDSAVLKPETKVTDPSEMLTLMGYTNYVPKEGNVKPIEKDGVWIFENVAISDRMIARVEIGIKEGKVCCMIITADKEKGLPTRAVVSLQPLAMP